MRAVVQRVKDASVLVGDETTGAIDRGLLVYLGVGCGDGAEDARYLADKVANLRIYEDGDGKMNRSVLEAGGKILAVSQFTLLADARKGRRPSFSEAAGPEAARVLYAAFCEALRAQGLGVEEGRFQAEMEVRYTNLGPVTILLDSRKLF
jgi:D-tyrosyl-tRNA(Tyr) deacylase